MDGKTPRRASRLRVSVPAATPMGVTHLLAELVTLALALHTPASPEAPDAAWIEAQVAEANRLFAPAEVRFEVTVRRDLPEAEARLEDRADRDALAAHVVPKTVNFFAVLSLRDVDDPSQYRRGVHWRWRKDRSRRYVIVSKVAGPSVLAHELGHFFGNGHTDVVDNVMSYRREDPAKMAFDEAQVARIRKAVRRAVRTRALSPGR